MQKLFQPQVPDLVNLGLARKMKSTFSANRTSRLTTYRCLWQVSTCTLRFILSSALWAFKYFPCIGYCFLIPFCPLTTCSLDPDHRQVPVTFEDRNPQLRLYKYTPVQHGPHSVQITYKNKHISNTPAVANAKQDLTKIRIHSFEGIKLASYLKNRNIIGMLSDNLIWIKIQRFFIQIIKIRGQNLPTQTINFELFYECCTIPRIWSLKTD